MNKKLDQKFASIKIEHQIQGITWLRLSPGKSKEDGIFILLYKDISESCLYDNWFENMEVAKEWAEKYYDVKLNDWEAADDLIKRGIQFIDEM